MKSIELVPFLVTLHLTVGREDWLAAVHKHDLDDRTWLGEKEWATTWSSGSHIFVTTRDMMDNTHSIMTHEAVHVFQAMCEYISEPKPGAEISAYLIQHVTDWLVKEHNTCLQESMAASLALAPSPSSLEPPGSTLPTSSPKSARSRKKMPA